MTNTDQKDKNLIQDVISMLSSAQNTGTQFVKLWFDKEPDNIKQAAQLFNITLPNENGDDTDTVPTDPKLKAVGALVLMFTSGVLLTRAIMEIIEAGKEIKANNQESEAAATKKQKVADLISRINTGLEADGNLADSRTALTELIALDEQTEDLAELTTKVEQAEAAAAKKQKVADLISRINTGLLPEGKGNLVEARTALDELIALDEQTEGLADLTVRVEDAEADFKKVGDIVLQQAAFSTAMTRLDLEAAQEAIDELRDLGVNVDETEAGFWLEIVRQTNCGNLPLFLGRRAQMMLNDSPSNPDGWEAVNSEFSGLVSDTNRWEAMTDPELVEEFNNALMGSSIPDASRAAHLFSILKDREYDDLVGLRKDFEDIADELPKLVNLDPPAAATETAPAEAATGPAELADVAANGSTRPDEAS